ncbi:rod shape-determining protein MreD [Fictibacillus aquaticus]|uniref:Rod shape-determining protein MreD n=1 Tax=Fictibacillus aquaticus TaxID=2021314 RepID=A0A235F9V5_9BACL|nr:rod shape-determining protein MreD [Fictibacillus aquaticus]OYD58068.1 rod shape-determining protein MreD [Fictibacillus aquaticus]
MMNRILLPFLAYVAFVAESTIMQVMLPEYNGEGWLMVPRFTLVIILFISMYLKPQVGIAYALVFGLLTDLLYTDIIGVYMFSMALTAYLTSVFSRLVFGNVFVAFFLSLIGVTCLETLVFGLNSLVGVADMAWGIYLYDRLLPTLLLNGVFTLAIYYFIDKHLQKIKDRLN